MSNDTTRPRKRDINRCTWHLVSIIAQEPCTVQPKFPMHGTVVTLCPEHMEQVATTAGWFSPAAMRKKIGERVKVIADSLVTTRDQEIARLRDELDTPKASKPHTEQGHIYILLSDNLVKIGWTADLARRMKAYSPGARILAVQPGTRADETRLHKKYADLKANRREWFTYHPRVMEEVERIVREYGPPPRDLNEPMSTNPIKGPRLNGYTQLRARTRR